MGLALGWGTEEALVIAGAVGISSSAIATKLLVELRRLTNPESRLILGINVVQDVFLAFYLALLGPVLGDAHGLGEALVDFGKAFGFLLALTAVARWGSRYAGKLVDSPDDELLTVAFVGLAVLVAGVAAEIGVSEAIGAFLVGMILAETAAHDRIERLVLPLRDTFAALFFFAFGVSIDVGDVGDVLGPACGGRRVVGADGGGGRHRRPAQRVGRRAAVNIGTTMLGRGALVDPRHARPGGGAGRAPRSVRGRLRARDRGARSGARGEQPVARRPDPAAPHARASPDLAASNPQLECQRPGKRDADTRVRCGFG